MEDSREALAFEEDEWHVFDSEENFTLKELSSLYGDWWNLRWI